MLALLMFNPFAALASLIGALLGRLAPPANAATRGPLAGRSSRG